jgi:hypothetical protein
MLHPLFGGEDWAIYPPSVGFQGMIASDSALHENSITETEQAQIVPGLPGMFGARKAAKGFEMGERVSLVIPVLSPPQSTVHNQ